MVANVQIYPLRSSRQTRGSIHGRAIWRLLLKLRGCASVCTLDRGYAARCIRMRGVVRQAGKHQGAANASTGSDRVSTAGSDGDARSELQMAPDLMLDLARQAAELLVNRIQSLPGEGAWDGDFQRELEEKTGSASTRVPVRPPPGHPRSCCSTASTSVGMRSSKNIWFCRKLSLPRPTSARQWMLIDPAARRRGNRHRDRGCRIVKWRGRGVFLPARLRIPTRPRYLVPTGRQHHDDLLIGDG